MDAHKNTDTIGSTHVGGWVVCKNGRSDASVKPKSVLKTKWTAVPWRCPVYDLPWAAFCLSIHSSVPGMSREPLCSVALRETKRHGRRGHGKSASSFQVGAEKQLATLDLWCPQGAIYSLALHDKHKVSYFPSGFPDLRSTYASDRHSLGSLPKAVMEIKKEMKKAPTTSDDAPISNNIIFSFSYLK
jgi:hypothetical protein